MARAKVRLNFQDGTEITNAIRISMRERFVDPLDSLEFVCKPPRDQVRDYYDRLRKGELVAALVDGKAQIVGAVDTLSVISGPGDGVVFQVTASPPIKMLYEAAAAQSLTKVLQADASVLDLVLEAIEPFGLSEVAGETDLVNIRTKTGKGSGAVAVNVDALKYSEAVVQPNETVYQFLARVLTRLGVMLRMDPTGLVYVTAPHYDGDPLATLVQAAAGAGPVGDRFFGDVEIVESNEAQYSFCEITGAATDKSDETRANVPKARVLTTDLSSSRPPFRASTYIYYKPMFLRDTNCRDVERAQSMAKLKLGLAAESAFRVSGQVDGLVSRDGIPWTVDTLCHVFVDSIDLDEPMWISERTFTQDAEGGQRTNITLLPKGALVLGDTP